MITDIAIPDLDGYQLFLRARDINENMPIIMMTGFGYDPKHVIVNVQKSGLKDILYKPFDTDKLVTLIKNKLNLP
jgi:FixJ family two-component response regulator